MLGIISEILSSYAIPLDAATEFDLFFVPLVVIFSGLGLSLFLSCAREVKTVALTRLEQDDRKTVQVQELVAKLAASQAAVEEAHKKEEEEEDGQQVHQNSEEEFPPTRVLSMRQLDTAASDTPQARIGASADFDPVAGILVVAGGMVDDIVSSVVDIYSVDEKKWVRFTSAQGGLGFLYGHLALLNESIVVFGGVGEDNNPKDLLQIFNFDTLTWEALPLLPVEGQQQPARPCARFNGSTCVLGDSRMVIFGGRDGEGACYNDVWMLEFKENSGVWTNLYASREVPLPDEEDAYVPEAREAHSAVIVGNKMIIFGGSTAEGDIINTEGAYLEVFDLETGAWSLHETSGEGPQILASGGSAHAMPDVGKVLVLSGEDSDKSFFNAAYILDVSPLLPSEAVGEAEVNDSEIRCSWTLFGAQWCGDVSMLPDSRLYYAAALDACAGDLYIFGGQQLVPDDDDETPLQNSVLVMDLSAVMELCTDPTEDEEAQKSEVSPPRAEDDAETSLYDEENVSTDNVNMGKLFASIDDTLKKNILSAENETLEDFLKIKNEVDYAFASRYVPDAELKAMKQRLFGHCPTGEEEEDSAPRDKFYSSCPLPGKKCKVTS